MTRSSLYRWFVSRTTGLSLGFAAMANPFACEDPSIVVNGGIGLGDPVTESSTAAPPGSATEDAGSGEHSADTNHGAQDEPDDEVTELAGAGDTTR